MKVTNYLLFLVGFLPLSISAQQWISGKVTDVTDGSTLPGVSVMINTSDGKKTAVVTGNSGTYTLDVPISATELIFSYIGMFPKTEKINGRTMINVQLSPDSKQLENVVVTALGIKRETKALSYSRQTMDVSTLTQATSSNIVSSLSGRIAGVQVTPASTNTGSARVVIRGNNSITGNNQPLFVIDGIPVDNESGDGKVTTSGNSSLDYGNVAANINPEDIAVWHRIIYIL
jgi:hypothetical protein